MNGIQLKTVSDSNTVWNSNFILLLFSNVMLYTGVYLLFPVLHRWGIYWHVDEFTSTFVAVAFGVGLFIPGVFNNYLVDRFSRKMVCRRSMLCFALVGLLYPYATGLWTILTLRIVQGSLFGLVLMATGSTLVIDVTPSRCRDKANVYFAYSGMVGMMLGLSLGMFFCASSEILSGSVLKVTHCMLISAAFSFVSLLLVSLVKVSFRAPMDLPMLSFDRFLLKSDFVPGLNMMVIPLVLGMIIGSSYSSFFYLCVGTGLLAYLLVSRAINAGLSARVAVGIGLAMLLVGMYMLSFGHSTAFEHSAGVMIGFGTGLSIYRFLKIMVKMPLHCERGTGYHTYQLMWELSMMIGISFGHYYCVTQVENPYNMVTWVVLVGFLLFVFYEYPHFKKVMYKRDSNGNN